jgi:hypothetical protein
MRVILGRLVSSFLKDQDGLEKIQRGESFAAGW